MMRTKNVEAAKYSQNFGNYFQLMAVKDIKEINYVVSKLFAGRNKVKLQ